MSIEIKNELHSIFGRVKHLSDKPCNWDAFYGRCREDEPNKPIVDLVRNLIIAGYIIVYMTGRRDSERFDTEFWLGGFDIDSDHLYMRKTGDFRHDTEVKPELMDRFLAEHDCSKDDIAFILEDRNSMVNKWRELGYTCLQVAEGDF